MLDRLEAVTVCVGYADFLREVVPYNLAILDRWIIVTSGQDQATRELCRRYSLECLLTEEHKRGGAFRKGHAIDRGLRHVSADGWRLHLDADIALPRHTRHLLDIADLQTDTIYGADRVMVHGWDDWQRLKRSGWMDGGSWTYGFAVNFPKGFEVGTRWASPTVGYCPIGFTQIWHSDADKWRGSRIKSYPVQHNDACRSDVQMALKWDRCKRALIPELIVVHLESERSKLGVNWKGRQSRPFGPAANQQGPTGY